MTGPDEIRPIPPRDPRADLGDLRAHGGDPADACHAVVPVPPRPRLSGPVREPGRTTDRIAAAFAEPMRRLGYVHHRRAGVFPSAAARHALSPG